MTGDKQKFYLMWTPDGTILRPAVMAKSRQAAKQKTPKPFNKYKGEIAVLTEEERNCMIYGTDYKEKGIVPA